ncbi:MAG: bifunctional GNAT family N-acetyltransferase/carbon-nitrogen hydrolase family protein [Neomegalonema sp.]|nr:bifunctional GNAT family N-acetyltransferase/carbon-nitrogen hydrolase family protein [Neomegalonema sp.]
MTKKKGAVGTAPASAARGESAGLGRRSVLEIRRTEISDIPELIEISRRVYPDEAPYEAGQLRGQIDRFPEGQFVSVYDGRVVGFVSTFRISERAAFAPHSWDSITGGGYAARHDGRGRWLYGMEVAVDPAYRRFRIGQRLYDARKRLVQELGLKGVVFGGRLPGFARRRKEFDGPQEYFEAVRDGRVKDPVARFQIMQGFEPVRLLDEYAPDDRASGGVAALMAWRNPDFDEHFDRQPITRRNPQIVRVTAVQLQARPAQSVAELLQSIEYFVDVASDNGSDFVVFPEHFSLALLAGHPKRLSPEEAMSAVAGETRALVDGMSALAVRFNINIIGGSHPSQVGDEVRNVAYACLRDGAVVEQEKLHVTPDERDYWRIRGGTQINAFDTDCGPVAIMICYDSEFPELARRVVDQGARILFVPYATDNRQGHLRVKLCCQARAIENQVFVVTAGNVGNLPNVENMDLNYAQSGVYTPCDYAFARDGVAAEADANVETAATADLDLSALAHARAHGAVRNFRDRRFDLYKVIWRKGS